MDKIPGNQKLWLVLQALLLLPFIIISFYNHPSADDFILAAVVRDHGAFAHIKQVYLEWSGRYFTTFINCFNPLVFGSVFGYKLIAVALILLFYTGLFSFISALFEDKLKTLSKHLFSLTLLLLYFNNITSTAESIYWTGGSLNYFLANIITLFFFALMLKTFYSYRAGRANSMLLFMLPLVIIGCNEISMLLIDELLLIMFLLRVIKKRKISKHLIIPCAAALIATVIVLTTPGNYYKMGAFTGGGDPAFSLQQCVISLMKISGRFIQNPAFVIVTMIFIAFIPLFKNGKIYNEITCFSPFVVLPLTVLILLSLYFPVVYSTGLNPALRIHDAVGLVFVFAWFYNISVLHNYLFQKKKIAQIEVPAYLVKLLATGAFILTVTGFSKEPGKQIVFEGNIFRAGYDLFYKAAIYNNDMNSRYEIISSAVKESNKNITVPALTEIPATIHFIDITGNPANWVNISAAKYFRLDSVRLIKELR